LILLALSLLLTGCEKNDVEPELPSSNTDVWQYNILYRNFLTKKTKGAGWQYTNKTITFRQEIIPFYKDTLDKLRTLSTENMDRERRLNRDIFEDYLIKEIQGAEFIPYAYQINQYDGIPIELPGLLAQSYPIYDSDYARSYIDILSGIPETLKIVEDDIKTQFELGIAPPSFVVSSFADTLSQFISVKPIDNILYTSCVEKTAELDEAVDIQEDVLSIITEEVYPAYQDLYQFLLDNQEKIEELSVTAGVWQLPQGDEYYAYLARLHTTTNLTPQEIHDIGLREVERIHKVIQEKLQEMGLGDRDPVAYLRELSNKDLITDEEEILNQYRLFITKAKSFLPKFFSRVPDAPIEIRAVPTFREATYSTAYVPVYEDQPGILMLGLSSPHAKSDIEAVTYHETIPGHHLQNAWLLEFKIPAFRDWITHTAYKEGWALYAERLMYENGCYSDAYSELGYLHSDLFRAARLVIDTGIHYKRWTRDEAIDYLWEVAGLKRDSEIDRYIVWPGQALAYKIGELQIFQLREMAREQLGEKFDIKEFHDVILSTGSVPLNLLEQQVILYIEEKQNTPEALLPTAPCFFVSPSPKYA
jgi:uncharacterized protein (DUF885 family)